MDLDEKERALRERLERLEQLEKEIKAKEKAVKQAEKAKKQVILRIAPVPVGGYCPVGRGGFSLHQWADRISAF